MSENKWNNEATWQLDRLSRENAAQAARIADKDANIATLIGQLERAEARVAELEQKVKGYEDDCLLTQHDDSVLTTQRARIAALEEALRSIADHHDRTRANEHNGACDWINAARALLDDADKVSFTAFSASKGAERGDND